MSKNTGKLLPKNSNLKVFLNGLTQIENLDYSTSLVERICESGDTTGSPFFHWRWKKKYYADVIIWPETEAHVLSIVKLAQKTQTPITTRGAGTCYFGSSVPAYGGAVLDVKRMDKYNLDLENRIVKVQPGISFYNLMQFLEKENLELGCYPTSALSATLGGWMGTGGEVGIGTLRRGSFINQILELQVVMPEGEIKTINNRKELKIFFGSCGIYGIITEFTLKVKKKEIKLPLAFGFTNFNDVLHNSRLLTRNTTVFYVRFSDREYEIRCRGNGEYSFYLFIVLSGDLEEIQSKSKEIFEMVKENGGKFIDKEYSEKMWDEALKYEMIPKRNAPVLMLQSLYTDINQCSELIVKFNKHAQKYQLNHAFYGIINRDLRIRLMLFTPTDNKYMNHFLSSKAILHKIVKKAYQSDDSRVYTYGLLNTLYLLKFEKEKRADFKELKATLDPNAILNPCKLTSRKVRFRRINTIFAMNLFWRYLAIKLKIRNIKIGER